MKLSHLLQVACTLIMSDIVATAPLRDLIFLEERDPASADVGATALYTYIGEDSEIVKKKAKREEEATALYAYIAEDSELNKKKAKREGEATALYAYIAHYSDLED